MGPLTATLRHSHTHLQGTNLLVTYRIHPAPDRSSPACGRWIEPDSAACDDGWPSLGLLLPDRWITPEAA